MSPPSKAPWLLSLICLAVRDILWGVVSAPFATYTETPSITFVSTEFNDQFVQQTPALHAYSPSPWLSGPYAQMLFFQSLACSANLQFTKKLYTLRDGVRAAVDFKAPPLLPADAPLVVICHGLGGNSENGMIVRISEHFAERGWRTGVYIRRGHDGMSLLPVDGAGSSGALPKGFPRHCDVDDMHDISLQLRAEFPGAPMVALGFSAGANIVARYLGQHSAASPYVAGASVCNGMDVNDVTIELERNRRTSDQILLYYLKTMLHQRLGEAKVIAEMRRVAVDWPLVFAATSVRSFERHLMVPLYGHASVEGFYAHNNSIEWLPHIRVPTLLLSTWDDPFIARHLPEHAIAASKSNPHVIAVVTKRGGHLGWFEGFGKTWAAQVIVPFMEYAVRQGALK